MKKQALSLSLMSLVFVLGVVAQASIPEAVRATYEQMKADGVDQRASYNKNLGVFVVANGEAEITGSKAHAKTIAKTKALENLSAFLGVQVESAAKHVVSESTVGEQSEIREFFSKTTKTKIKQLLKGVQDLAIVDDGDKIIAWIYLTTKAQEKSKELDAQLNALGNDGTVQTVGEAKSHANAVQMALRVAVEQVAGTMVIGETKVANDELMRNKIFSGAEGFVDTYRIIQEVELPSGWRVNVIAKVSKKKILDTYRTYLKAMGDPVFYLQCTSSDSDGEDKQIAARFGEFFRKLGFKISKTSDGADFCINASGEYRRVKNPVDEEQVFTQYSMVIKILSKTGEELLSIPNNPRKSSVCINNPDREREICAEKAFKQMEKPVHEAINSMVARMMADHTDKLMNSND